MNDKYQTLKIEMFKKGITGKMVATELNITPKALYNKISGKSPFTWEQACKIHASFFPELDKDLLFKCEDTQANQKAG